MKDHTERILKLKSMTMRPPLFVEDRIAEISAKLMFGNHKGIAKDMLKKQLNSYQVQLQVELLPTTIPHTRLTEQTQ